VLIFFIAGLLYLLRFERVDNLGAYSIPSETGLLIPSDYNNRECYLETDGPNSVPHNGPGSVVPHDYGLVLGCRSVHTSTEARISEIQARQVQQGTLRTHPNTLKLALLHLIDCGKNSI
jgi:hypothetical protein